MTVTFESLAVSLAGRTVLHNISLTIPAGASVAILGVSGAGKTTLLRSAAGLLKPTSGRVLVNGGEPRGLYGKGAMAFLFQEACLWRHLTALETIDLTLKLYGYPSDRGRALGLLERVGLSAFGNYYPHQMSVGMKARLAIARAFCVTPSLLLMDEPFAALDPLRRLDLNRQVQTMRSEANCTVLWVTHDVVEALQFATHVIALPHGAHATEMIDLRSLPPIPDGANLPSEALAMRDRLLEMIVGHGPVTEEMSAEVLG
ncbi:MAG: ABC transporter ATP-binding protein [Acidobacteria bacterium]|nr:ABC transporter ATP-binding protein [Acidobacteriota bacterium]